MVRTTLLIAGLVAIAVGVIYAFVAGRLAARHVQGPAERRALHHFVLWWAATSLNVILGGLTYVAASFDWYDFTLQLSYAILQRMLLAASVYGLVYYLLYLLTARSMPRLLGATYTGLFLLLAYSVFASQPTGVHIGDWRTDLEYAGESPAIQRILHSLLILAPPVVLSAIGLVIALRRRSRLPADGRYRLALTCGALIVWWTFAVIAGQREAIGQESFQLVNRFVGLAAALVVLAAFRPPYVIRRRFAHRPAAA